VDFLVRERYIFRFFMAWFLFYVVFPVSYEAVLGAEGFFALFFCGCACLVGQAAI
jgi:hypothetical protein